MRCTLCPRLCGAERTETAGSGFCRMPAGPVVARAGLHMWEEPCISGTRGSGTVFFSGCTLGCVFCQNHEISAQGVGKPVSVDRLREIFRELIRQGAHNINLVTPGHFAPWVAQALEPSLPVPVVCNTGGYERVETLRLLEGKVQVYLPDMKYALEEPARRLSGAGDYPAAARSAICEMFRQTGPYQLRDGLLVREPVEGDARLKRLVLTPIAQEQLSQMQQDLLRVENKATAALTKQELETLFTLLDKVRGSLAPGKEEPFID